MGGWGGDGEGTDLCRHTKNDRLWTVVLHGILCIY